MSIFGKEHMQLLVHFMFWDATHRKGSCLSPGDKFFKCLSCIFNQRKFGELITKTTLYLHDFSSHNAILKFLMVRLKQNFYYLGKCTLLLHNLNFLSLSYNSHGHLVDCLYDDSGEHISYYPVVISYPRTLVSFSCH